MSQFRQQLLELARSVDAHARDGRVDRAIEVANELKSHADQLRSDGSFRTEARLPDILIVGPARTGTTWLKSVLGRHPDIMMARGEPNVLWNIGSGNLTNAISFYLRDDIWRGQIKQKALIAEKSPGYILLPDIDLTILSILCPSLSIIAGRRSEIDRMWSLINHNMRRVSFPGDWKDFCRENHHEIVNHLNSGRIAFHLDRWRRKSQNWNIIIVDFDFILQTPYQMIDSMFTFFKLRSFSSLPKHDVNRIRSKILMNPNPGQYMNTPESFREILSQYIYTDSS